MISNLVVLEALLAAGAELTARDESGSTPLHGAAGFNENPAVVDTLLAAGADPMARTDEGDTPLHHSATYNDNPAVLETLLAAGADLMARNEDGDTPLHRAASRSIGDSHAGVAITALLAAGADPTTPNAAGQTPWDLAQENQAFRGSDAYWRLNDARFNSPEPDVRRRNTPPPDRPQAAASPRPQSQRQGPGCEIPGYPTPAGIQNLSLSWCGSNVDFQRRAFALQVAGTWCALDLGTSSTPEQIGARHQEINAACDTLDALQSSGIPPCQCPAGYRP